MKKIVMSVILVLILGCAFAQEKESAAPVVRNLLQDGLFKNEALIQQEAINLTAVEKGQLFGQFEQEVVVPLAINFFFGLGIGSFVQEDYLGGAIGLGGELLGFGLFLGGYIPAFLTVYENDGSGEIADKAVKEAIPVMVAGGVILLGAKIFEMVRPFVYTNSFNNTLKKSLGLRGVGYNVLPTYNFNTDKLALVASIKVNL